MLNIEVSAQELNQKFDQVYADICKVARVPGYRPGHVPRDLLETYYGERAKADVIKRAMPEYYLKAVREEKLAPVAPPEVENVQFKNHILCFSVRIDVRPNLKLKAYKNLKIIKKKIKIEPSQVEQVLERLPQSKAKEEGNVNEKELRAAIKINLQENAEIEIKADMERQILEQLLNRASLDIPESLVNSQKQELLNQLKSNYILQGGKKEEVGSKVKEWEDEVRKESMGRVKLSFILEEIAQRENIQVSEGDLDKRIEVISQRSGKNKDEVKRYLEIKSLIPGLKAELRDRKTREFLLSEAKVIEEKNTN